MTDGRELELAETFADVARVLLAEDDVDATLDRMCHLVVQTIDACECAGISLLKGRTVHNRTSTDHVPQRLDELRSETQEGPCVDAITKHEVFMTGCLSADRRWPKFSTRAHEETGIQSILSLRLFAEEDTMGALNLYSTQVDAFDERDIAVGAVFATHAAVAMQSAREKHDLEIKAQGRDAIGMAKGMIVARQGVSPDEAFEILRRASQRLNIKLREVADRMVDGGMKPELSSPDPP